MKLIICLLLSLTSFAQSQIPASTQQVIVGIAPSWNSSHVTLSVFERTHSSPNSSWQLKGQGWQGRLGRKGLAWGIGIHSHEAIKTSHNKLYKKEGDGRAPAGIFRIGGAYGYAPAIQKKPRLPYRQITTRDLWVEDSKAPNYNRHLILSHEPKSAWEKKAQMRQGDYAHSLKLFIRHNAPIAKRNARPYAGSSIFFHIWRAGGRKPTAGCTTMAPDKLKSLIATIDPAKNPVYVLLTAAEYKRLRSVWKLP